MKGPLLKTVSGLFILSLTAAIFTGLLYLRENYFLKPTSKKPTTSSYEHHPIPGSFPVYPGKVTDPDYPYLRPSYSYMHTFKRGDGSLIYKVDYRIDGAGYRNRDEVRLRKTQEHLLIVGCSIVFGLGLPQEETLSSQMEIEFPDTAVYNLGLSGSGPQDHSKLFTDYPLKNYVSQPDGKMIYVYFPDHYSRINLDPHYLDWAEPKRPVYVLEGDSKIKFAGRLQDQERWKNYQRIKQSGLSHSTLEMAKITKYVTPEKVKLTALLIKSVKDKYLNDFPNGEFYFVVLPHTYPFDEATQGVLAELKRLNVITAPYEEMATEFNDPLVDNVSPYVIGPEEGHPSALANRKFAHVLARWLKESAQKKHKTY